MKTLFTVLAVLIAADISAQINVADSSLQVIGYWTKNEKQSYNVINTKYKVIGSDTSAAEVMSYGVDVVVTDSTAKSYTIEWQYKKVNAEGVNPFVSAMLDLASNSKVVIKTDEMGAFAEVVNWKEVQSLMKKGLDKIRKDFKTIPNIKEITAEVEKTLTTKEAIENQGILDILQFYTFHGAKYTMNEDYNQKLVSNGIPGAPVDVDMTVRLTDLDVEADNGIVRVWKTFDVKQMTDATFLVMNNMTKSAGGKLLTRDQMPEVAFEETISSRVHGGSGWVIYSIQTKQTSTGGNVEIEERVIELL